MRYKFYLLIAVGTIISCATMKQRGDLENPLPFLTDIGKYSNPVINSDFYKVGTPSVNDYLNLSVTEVTFTKAKFKKYLSLKKAKGEKPGIAYIDSIPDKPKYLSLIIADQIEMVELLNNQENIGVLSYLEKDEDYRIVSQISLVTDPKQIQEIVHADNIRLIRETNSIMVLQIIKASSRTQLKISKLEVFDFNTSGFCWEEDKFGKKKIGILTAKGEECPSGTERKANKLDDTKSYLKL